MRDFIWYEKHRPKKIKDLVLPQAHRKAFRTFIKGKEIPHLLFHGPAGSGKTTLSQILINKCSSNALVLNASANDRGIATIKNKVTQFAKSVRSGDKLKIVFFDEANGLTPEAQEALKNPIEKFQRNCRFVFATNEYDKIVPAIISRCQVFKFDSLPQKVLLTFLQTILEEEGVEYKDNDVNEIMNMYYPDVRTIMNSLQASSIGGKLDIKEVLTVLDTKLMAKHLNKGKIFALRHLFAGASDFLWLYKWLFNGFIWDMPKNVRGEAALIVADYLHRDRSITDKEINISACCIELMNLLDVELNFDKSY